MHEPRPTSTPTGGTARVAVARAAACEGWRRATAAHHDDPEHALVPQSR